MRNIVEEKLPTYGKNDDELRVTNALHLDMTKIREIRQHSFQFSRKEI